MMTPKMVYLGATCLAVLQTSQAFLLPPSLNPTVQPSANQQGETEDGAVHIQVMPKEDIREKMKNLQLGVSKPFPFSVPSSDDVEHANKKAKHYFKSVCKKLKHDASKFGNKAEGELEELDRKILDWWKTTVPSKKKEFEKELKAIGNDFKDLEEEVEDEIEDKWAKFFPDSDDNGDFEADFEGIDWSELGFYPSSIKHGHQDDVQDDQPQPMEDHFHHDDADDVDFEDIGSFRISFYSPDDDEANSDNSQTMFVEMINVETGERFRERIDLSAFDLDFEDEQAPHPSIFGSDHIPNIHEDLDISPDWQDKLRLSQPTRAHMRCTASKFRRFLHSVASGIRAFVTGFLIPVLIGVAAGMAASLLGMLVGTVCGWLWVKLFHRSEPEDSMIVTYRDAGDGIAEKDTLLTVESVDSDGDAPPVYVEKE